LAGVETLPYFDRNPPFSKRLSSQIPESFSCTEVLFESRIEAGKIDAVELLVLELLRR
jgi:hypothetical protein